MATDMSDAKAGLAHFPVTLFASSMGLWGWALASFAMAAVWPAFMPVALVLRVVATVAFVGLVLIYGAKLIRAPHDCFAEWQVPGKLAFFPAISISMLLVATGYLQDAPGMARVIWVIGLAFQGVLTLSVISSWISHRSFEVGQLSPAWFIPAVGNVIVPVAGVPLGYIELSWLFFSGGVLFWLVLLTLVMNRLVFHDPLPGKLVPTLVVLIAPPALGFLAYVTLTGGVDSFARVLLNAAYIFAMLVVIQLPKLATMPFALSWWALSFPVAGLCMASIRFGVQVASPAHMVIGAGLWAVLSGIVAFLTAKTLRGLFAGVFFQPER